VGSIPAILVVLKFKRNSFKNPYNLSRKKQLVTGTSLINFRRNKFLKNLLLRSSSTMTFSRSKIKSIDIKSVLHFIDKVPFTFPTLSLFLDQKTFNSLALKDLKPDYMQLRSVLTGGKNTTETGYSTFLLRKLLFNTQNPEVLRQKGSISSVENLHEPNLYWRATLVQNKQHIKTYALLISYLTNLNTLKFKNPTKMSLTRIDYNSFLNNSSFFSDMSNRGFINIKQTDLFTKSKHVTYGSLG
jgi:hypothetical protein